MKIKEIISAIEQVAPLWLQEEWDNSGIQVGNPELEATGAVLCTDVHEAVVDDAIALGYNLIVSHHPLIFKPLKKIAGRNYIERIVAKCIKHDITVYSSHTSMDSARGGVNYHIAERLGLTNVKVLDPQRGTLRKVVVFVPGSHADAVERAMHEAGAGHIGDYDQCSYRVEGEGSYRALAGASPFAGRLGTRHTEPETRLEVIVHKSNCGAVVKALLAAHPYEEPAFDVIALDNADPHCGIGVVGDLPQPMSGKSLLLKVKRLFNVASIRYSGLLGREVTRVALCGGAGSYLAGAALANGAQAFLTGDMKYHEFMGHEHDILLADIGHFESEQFTKEIFLAVIQKKNPNFAVCFAKSESNQLNYI